MLRAVDQILLFEVGNSCKRIHVTDRSAHVTAEFLLREYVNVYQPGKLPLAIGSGTYAQRRRLLHFSAFIEVLPDNAKQKTAPD